MESGKGDEREVEWKRWKVKREMNKEVEWKRWKVEREMNKSGRDGGKRNEREVEWKVERKMNERRHLSVKFDYQEFRSTRELEAPLSLTTHALSQPTIIGHSHSLL
ncbi:hypothetical protein Pcinc_039365 [Petrolisthes cinctipes]|uniref:Uncharacterized protein n=1 Tax=Petrolisthes cinctipes TaxID=88211 RepID=A0AAE1BP41_PETCI|nr:hypothetical protein Pcinc_039365 [Petrolisthes cinctipes]